VALKFPSGIIRIIFNGSEYEAEYIGRQKGFECLVCGKGENCFTFNVFENKSEHESGNYETWGFGDKHINQIAFYQWEWLENTVVLHASSEDAAKMAYKKMCEIYPNNTLYESTAGYNANGTYDAIFWKRHKN
jgi:hypothetical protein